jgi:transposase InsO family protein
LITNLVFPRFSGHTEEFQVIKNKMELVYFEKYRTRQEARGSIFEYIEVFYNRVRRHSALNYCSPVEFERQVCET